MDTAARSEARSAGPALLVGASLAILAAAVATGVGDRAAVAGALTVTVLALVRRAYLPWSRLLAVLIAIILFIPIRRYSLPGSLPFELEPYRVFVALLVLGWAASLLVDRRVRFRRTSFDGPLVVIVGAVLASIVANPERVARVGSEVDKSVMFFISFVVLVYLIASVIQRLDDVDRLAKTLVVGGAAVAVFAVVESRVGFNVFNYLDRVMPFLRPGEPGEPESFVRYGAAKLRVFASAQHPIALSAALVLLSPLALYLARRYEQRRWLVCAIALIAGCAATVSRTGIVMLVVVGVVFLCLRPRETLRAWPALVIALVLIKFGMPGTLGAIKQSFLPAGGLIAEQQSNADGSGSGRLADLGPALQVWKQQPLLGQGYGTHIVNPHARGIQANILDNQWLGMLLATGIVGVFGWLWLFVRAIRRLGAEAREDDSARGWLLAALAAGIASYAVGMLTYDAFAFIQVTFLAFIYLALGAALLAERPTPLAARTRRRAPYPSPAP